MSQASVASREQLLLAAKPPPPHKEHCDWSTCCSTLSDSQRNSVFAASGSSYMGIPWDFPLFSYTAMPLTHCYMDCIYPHSGFKPVANACPATDSQSTERHAAYTTCTSLLGVFYSQYLPYLDILVDCLLSRSP